MQYSLLAFFALFFSVTFGQNEIDALKKSYPNQKGKERAQTLIDLSYLLSTKNPKEAKYYGRLAEKEAVKLKDSSFIATIWNDWSFAYLYDGDLDSALLLNEKALEYRTKLRDTIGMGKSLNKIATTYYEKGLHDKSLKAHLQSLKYFEKSNQVHYFGQVFTNIANIYERNNQLNEAVEYNQKAIEELEKHKNFPAITITKINLASCYQKLNQLDKSRKLYQEALILAKEYQQSEQIAGIYQGLGVVSRKSGNLDEAIDYYTKSIQAYEEIGANSGISLVAVNLGNSYLAKKQFADAEKFLKKGLDLALQMKSNYNIRHAYKGLFKLETLKGNSELADNYFDLYVAQMDSIYNEQTTNAISEMSVQYKTEKKELALKDEQLKNKNKNLILITLIFAIIILAIIAIIAIQRRKIDNQSLRISNLQNLDTERSRIARDLHDNLGAELTLISSKLDMKMFKSHNEDEKRELMQIRDISSNANHVLRETIWSIHKQELTIEELYQKTKEYANRLLEDKEIRYQIEVHDNSESLTPSLALHLFRIIQESINNASKYANCSELTVKIRKGTIEITDNGIGFDIDSVQKGYGLQNMQDRIKEIKGTIEFNSIKGTGTSILVHY